MQINPYLNFSGNCEEAMEFYAKTFNGKILFKMTFGESPAAQHTPAEWHRKIMHATLGVGEQSIMGCDGSPEHYQKPQGTWVSLNIETPEEAERIYAALAEGAEIRMPIAETFWDARFAMLVDRFGTPWMINCEKTH